MLAQQSSPDGKIIAFPALGLRASVLQENLSAGLKALSASVNQKSKLEVLKCVRLQSENTRIVLTATDLETMFQISVGGKIESPGCAVVYFDTLHDLVNLLTPERVDLAMDINSTTLELRCGSSVSHHKGISAAEFPACPTPDHAQLLGIIDLGALLTELERLSKLGNGKSEVRLHLSATGLHLLSSEGHQATIVQSDFAPLETAFQMNLFTFRTLIKKLNSIEPTNVYLDRESVLGFGDWQKSAWINTTPQPIIAEKPFTIVAEMPVSYSSRQLLNGKTSLTLDFKRGEVLIVGSNSETTLTCMRESSPVIDAAVTLQGVQLEAALKLLRSIIGNKSKQNPDGNPLWFGITANGEAAIAPHTVFGELPAARQWTIFRRIVTPLTAPAMPYVSLSEEDITGVTAETIELTENRFLDLTVNPPAVFIEAKRLKVVSWDATPSNQHLRWNHVLRWSNRLKGRIYIGRTFNAHKNWKRDAVRHLLYKQTGQFSTGSWNVDAQAIRRAIAWMKNEPTAVYDAAGRALKAGSQVIHSEDGELYQLSEVDAETGLVATSGGVTFFGRECQRVAHTSASCTIADIRKAAHAYYGGTRVVKIIQTAKAERTRYGRSKPAQYKAVCSDGHEVSVDQYGKLFTVASVG